MRIIGHYVIESEIGDGGMGVVYRGRDPRFDRTVAIKILHDQYRRDPAFRDRFKTEAVIQAKLSHPHIVSVIDFVADDTALAMVLEYVEGPSLADVIRDARGPVARHRALRLIDQILAALAYAHERGLVHRDIKPSNVLVASYGTDEVAKVLDFGIAKDLANAKSKTATGAKMGTLAYMPPEQIHSPKSVDVRADLYSVGVVLYELLTGRLPFDDDTEYGMMRAICEAPAPLHGLPSQVADVLERALEKDPARRFGTATEMRAALASTEAVWTRARTWATVGRVSVRPSAAQFIPSVPEEHGRVELSAGSAKRHSEDVNYFANESDPVEYRSGASTGGSPIETPDTKSRRFPWGLAAEGSENVGGGSPSVRLTGQKVRGVLGAVLFAGLLFAAYRLGPNWSSPATDSPHSPSPASSAPFSTQQTSISRPEATDNRIDAVPRIATVRIQTDLLVEKLLDGHSISELETVEPGEHTLSLRLPGVLGPATQTQRLSIAPGEAHVVTPIFRVGSVQAGELPFPFVQVTVQGQPVDGQIPAVAGEILTAVFGPQTDSSMAPISRSFKLEDRQDLTLATLVPTGAFHYRVTPAAVVAIETREFGQSSEGGLARIAAGEYRLRVSRTGYPDFSTGLSIAQGQDATREIAYSFASGAWVIR